VEVDGNRLYIADTNNHVIRVFDLETGDLSLVAGAFEAGPTSMNDDALLATLNTPHGIDIAPDGSVLIADTYNHQILRVNP
jgi:sugar lactone lactonase YvrE